MAYKVIEFCVFLPLSSFLWQPLVFYCMDVFFAGSAFILFLAITCSSVKMTVDICFL